MSAQSISLLTLPVLATGTITNSRFVVAAGTQAVADNNVIGVARADAVSGERVAVDVIGTAVVESGAAFSAGATLKSDASARHYLGHVGGQNRLGAASGYGGGPIH